MKHGEGDFWRAMAEWHGDHGMQLEAQEEGSAQDEGVGAWMEGIGTSQGCFSFSYMGSFLQGTKFKKQEEKCVSFGDVCIERSKRGDCFFWREGMHGRMQMSR